MNTDTFIEFKKQRELGDILSDTFAFMRNEFKSFFSVFFKIVGPYLLVMIIALTLYLYYVGNQFNFALESYDPDLTNGFLIFGLMFFYAVSILIVYAVSQSTVLHYIKSYTAGRGQINYEAIRNDVYATLLSFIGLIFLVAISLVAGFMICCFPGIYLWVPLSLAFSIMVFNRKGAVEAYGDSFNLVKDHWWMTFATLLIVAVIVGIAGYAFALPGTIYTYAKMGILSGEMDAESMIDTVKDPIYILLNIMASVAQFMLNIISLVAGALIYFNLNEKKNFTGAYERIQNLGETPEN
ncbi:hypothetical protein FK220_018295 [Flavobacteriaceae bacterium TP-CH-4]|uniref:Glycerophosphoryl diester phosphodiesterase membrane domain-containing protein n=1 Tax=Pelagihabitans pacificus TaxID=2696054 RepID=A0A967AXV4_9FLAO|nr:hypothetical protein [Pelagihabitans pacificus]NHF61310.1 hypothetical protein [Pelagihabitans pacificus]